MNESKSMNAGSSVGSDEIPAGRSATTSQPRRRRWLIRAMACAFPLVILVGVEAVLVLCGAQQDLSLVIEVAGDPEFLPKQLNSAADRPFFGTIDVAGPEDRRFARVKPASLFRAVVVGASTVQGFPYASELAFPRQLELLLNHNLPDREVEVLNAGIVSINSRAVSEIVRQVLDQIECDLIIVHTGHNEFYSPGGAASRLMIAPDWAWSPMIQFRKTRTFQWLTDTLVARPEVNRDLMETLPASFEISLHSDTVRLAVSRYRTNLQRIVKDCQNARVPVLLTTVASNIQDHSPVSTLIPDSLTRDIVDQWHLAFDQGRQLAAAQEWQLAVDSLQACAALNPGSALLQYRLGQCLQKIGEPAAARIAFELARDLDGCRFRAPTVLGTIVREIAEDQQEQGVFLADTDQWLNQQCGDEAPGNQFFLEHVHYNLDGHHQLAKCLQAAIVNQVLKTGQDTVALPDRAEFDEQLGVTVQDRLAALSFAIEVYSAVPMKNTFDHGLHRQNLLSAIGPLFQQLSSTDQEVFADIPVAEMGAGLLTALAKRYRQRGLLEKELEILRLAASRRFWDLQILQEFAEALMQRSDQTESAHVACERAVRLGASDPEFLKMCAELQIQTGSQPKIEQNQK